MRKFLKTVIFALFPSMERLLLELHEANDRHRDFLVHMEIAFQDLAEECHRDVLDTGQAVWHPLVNPRSKSVPGPD